MWPNSSSSIRSNSEESTSKTMNFKPMPTALRNRTVQMIIDLIVILVIVIIYALVYSLVNPKSRGFYCNDTDIFYPLKPDIIAYWEVGLYGIASPIILIIIIEALNAKKHSEQKIKFFTVTILHGFSLFILGLFITLLLTEIGKKWVGRLRPHFIEVCKPDFSKINCTHESNNGNLMYNYIETDDLCTGAPKDVKEARLSFPSGHSSTICYTMCFVILFVQARVILLKYRYLKPLIQMAAFIVAFVTCVSRIADYHHRGTDVIGGATLGCAIALFVGLLVGKVLWKYERAKEYHDFDYIPQE